ncbi:MAG: TorF family putative porin [Sphingomonadaceae bacterium]
MRSRMVGGLALAAALAAALAVAAAGPAGAQAAGPALRLSGGATLVSDYRWRGYSVSDRGVALQGILQLDHQSGFYIGTWASSIAASETGFPCDPPRLAAAPPLCAPISGAAAEVDVYGGWKGSIGPLDVNGGLLAYLYPGADGLDFFALVGTAGYAIGTLQLQAGLNWAPDQGALSGSNRYLFGSAGLGVPGTPVTIKALLGSERGSLVVDRTFQKTSKIDWRFGVDIAGSFIGLEPLTIGFAYSGNNLPDREGANSYAKNGFIFSIGASF